MALTTGGEFYTPRCVVKLLVEMIEPYKGRVYDTCCGSSGRFVQSEEFIRQHGGRLGDISIYGQSSNPTTRRLVKMNLAIRGIEANIGPHNAEMFHNDLHKHLKAGFIPANPPPVSPIPLGTDWEAVQAGAASLPFLNLMERRNHGVSRLWSIARARMRHSYFFLREDARRVNCQTM